MPAGDPFLQDGWAGGGRGGDLLGGGGDDPTKLKLQGVQRKWGRQAAPLGRADERADTAVQSGGSGPFSADVAVVSSHAHGGAPEPRGGMGAPARERSAAPEVPDEKVKKAAMLFGGKKGGVAGGLAGGDPSSSSPSSTGGSLDSLGGRSGPWGRKGGSRGGREGAGAQPGAAGDANGLPAAAAATAPQPPLAPPVADLMLLDLGDDQPGASTAAGAAAGAAVATPAPAADPFMDLEGLSVSGPSSLLDVGAAVDPLGLSELTAPSASASGDLLGAKQGAKEASAPGRLHNSDSLKGTAAAASEALKRDAVVRKVGIVSPAAGASAELFKDILG